MLSALRRITPQLLLTIALVATVNATTINYQGNLNDSVGDPVPDGTYSIVFKLYDDSTGGELQWSETRSVDIAKGYFNLYLGAVNPISASEIENSQFLEIVVEGEILSPRTRLSDVPFSTLSSRVKGDIITDSSRLTLPGQNPTIDPRAVELSNDGDGGALGIWGTNGTGQPIVEVAARASNGSLTMYPGSEWVSGPDTAIKLEVGSDGGALGIWGTNGTSQPLVEVVARASSGSLTMYPGHEWVSGPDTAIKLEVGSDGGALGIWGTNGTSQPLVEVAARASSGSLTMYPGHDWVSGPDTAIRLSVDAEGGSFGLWSANNTALPLVNVNADTSGGSFTLASAGGVPTMYLDGGATGDYSCILPADAIGAGELLDEPGIAQGRNTGCVSFPSTSDPMQDITTVSITIPTAGYILLSGSGTAEFSGTTGSAKVDIQIDETAGGGSAAGSYTRVGLAGYTSSSFNDFSFNVTRTYFKSAGSYTFRLEGKRSSGGSGTSTTACLSTLTALFIPTSYGAVSTVANSQPENPNAESANLSGLNTEGNAAVDQIDLRDYEIRAREARQRALEAELQLRKAQLTASDRNR